MNDLHLDATGAVIDLGDFVVDEVSGLEGVVVGVALWLHDTPSVLIQPRNSLDGSTIPARWIDAIRVGVTDETALRSQYTPRSEG